MKRNLDWFEVRLHCDMRIIGVAGQEAIFAVIIVQSKSELLV